MEKEKTRQESISRIFVFQNSEKCNNIFVNINKSMFLILTFSPISLVAATKASAA